jgi:hypothetical protein
MLILWQPEARRFDCIVAALLCNSLRWEELRRLKLADVGIAAA